MHNIYINNMTKVRESESTEQPGTQQSNTGCCVARSRSGLSTSFGIFSQGKKTQCTAVLSRGVRNTGTCFWYLGPFRWSLSRLHDFTHSAETYDNELHFLVSCENTASWNVPVVYFWNNSSPRPCSSSTSAAHKGHTEGGKPGHTIDRFLYSFESSIILLLLSSKTPTGFAN